MAIRILDEALPHQSVIDLQGRSLYDVSDVTTINGLIELVRVEQAKMRRGEKSIFYYGRLNQSSYPLKSFCSAALKSLKQYALYEHEVMDADRIETQETNPRMISAKLITHFDLTKESEDVASETRRRKGQDYFRRMILANYGGRCALTGIDIPQLLLASHIIPWADKTHKQDRLSPCNGIYLSALYNKAFDWGLITISPDDYTIHLSGALREYETQDYFDRHIGSISGQKITMPIEHRPNRDFFAYHRDHVFVAQRSLPYKSRTKLLTSMPENLWEICTMCFLLIGHYF